MVLLQTKYILIPHHAMPQILYAKYLLVKMLKTQRGKRYTITFEAQRVYETV